MENVRDGEFSNQTNLANESGISKGSLSKYLKNDEKLGKCIEKADGAYTLTPIGQQALNADWEALPG